jgi:hypothetical protein
MQLSSRTLNAWLGSIAPFFMQMNSSSRFGLISAYPSSSSSVPHKQMRTVTSSATICYLASKGMSIDPRTCYANRPTSLVEDLAPDAAAGDRLACSAWCSKRGCW